MGEQPGRPLPDIAESVAEATNAIKAALALNSPKLAITLDSATEALKAATEAIQLDSMKLAMALDRLTAIEDKLVTALNWVEDLFKPLHNEIQTLLKTAAKQTVEG